MIADGTIVNADVNTSAAIAGSKISPDFGSQSTTTTGTSTAASFIPTGATVPSNGIYLPAANQIGIATNSTQWVRITSTGDVNIKGAGTAGSTQAVSFSGSAPVDSLVVTSAGRVGAGTASPGTTVHALGGNVWSGSFYEVGRFQKTAGTAVSLGYDNAAYVATIGAYSHDGTASQLSFWTYPGSGTAQERMRLDTSGNLGLGVTPSAWGTNYAALQMKGGFNLTSYPSSSVPTGFISSNAYFNGTSWVYLASRYATRYKIQNDDGAHSWDIAPSGIAGNTTTITSGQSYTTVTSGNQTAFGAPNNNVGTTWTATSSGTLSSGTVIQNITFTQAMTLDASGRLLVGTTSAVEKQTLNGCLAITGASATSYYIGNNNGAFIDYASSQTRIGAQTSGSSGTSIGFFTATSDYTTITERARIDSSGNLGLGVTPSAWGSGYAALQTPNGGAFWSVKTGSPTVITSANAYFDGSSYKYLASNAATLAIQSGGQHQWYNAPSGTAGNPITFTQAMTLDASGRLLVGATSDSGGALLQVNGDRVRIATAKTPASATATGTTGEVCWDASYIYVCTATNTWKRAAIATW
jgi:hypothetical protein